MVMFVMCSFFYALIILFDLVPIYKQKDKKVFWIYLSIITFTYLIHIMIILNIDVPSPAEPIKNVIINIFNVRDS